MVPRPKLRTAALRDVIVEQAAQALDEGGPAALQARAVASAAGTSTAALYELFGDKVGLAGGGFYEGFRLLNSRLGTIPESADARDDVVRLLAEARAFAVDHPMLFNLMYARPFAEFEPGDDERRAAAEIYKLIVSRVRRWLAVSG